MALPDTSITTKEEYLRAIALGNTELPDHPVSREEQYLEVIAGNNAKLALMLPDPPEESGAYVLTATVDASGVTYTWESSGE